MRMNFEEGTIKEVITLSDEQIRKMKHALGISHDKKNREVVPNKIYRPKLISYRNHYQIDQCEDWDGLVTKGFAKKMEAIGMNFYLVTAEGIAHLKELGYQFEKAQS